MVGIKEWSIIILRPRDTTHTTFTSSQPFFLFIHPFVRSFVRSSGLLGFIWKEEEDSEDEVPLSVKRLLHRAQWCTGDLDYRGAEQCYHDALAALASSKHSKARTHTEARAVVLDKVRRCTHGYRSQTYGGSNLSTPEIGWDTSLVF